MMKRYMIQVGAAVSSLFIPSIIFAQTNVPDFVPLTPVQGTPFASLLGNNATLTGFFQSMFNLSITIGALLAVLMLAWSGWLYMTTDIVDKKGEAKKRIQNALLGLLMLLATVLILRQINPDIVSLRILQNTGSPAVSGQQQTTSSFTDSGIPMTNASGYCIDTGSANGGAHNSDYNRYICYTTQEACWQSHSPSECQGYSTTYTTPSYANDGNGGNGLGISPGTASYADQQWCPSGSLSCTANNGGWVAISNMYCGGTTASGTCYGLPKPTTYTSVATIPNGNWCYSTGSGTTLSYSCSSDQLTCDATRKDTSTPTSLCAQKTAATTATGLTTPVKTYSTYKYSTQLQVDSAGANSVNACTSPTLGGAGYEEVAINACTPSNSTNLGNSTTGMCCALPIASAATISDKEYTGDPSNIHNAMPANSYCYQLKGGSFYCSTGGASCKSNLANRMNANPTATLQYDCTSI